MANQIHPSALVSANANLDNVVVGPFAVIEDGVEISSGSEIRAGAVIRSRTIIGKDNVIGEHAVIGGDPQDIHFDKNKKTGVRIGDRNTIRELSTIHRATVEGGMTSVGNDNFLMAVSHLAHDVKVHNHVIICNNSLLAGFVEVFDRAFISGNCAIHQFVRIGRFVMIAGITKLPQDAPPFALIEGYPGQYRTINSLGLKRGGVRGKERDAIKHYYKVVYEYANIRDALTELSKLDLNEYGREMVEFISSSKRGILSSYGKNSQTPSE
ncbi:MAG: acyl-ACP--UDP-N-acetylglucosamine O-acyltransferase [Spirochaetia bacterium]|nr:acyl-ACP--UDP-N-acetylglucosamine O-acyltransferase [Spirochaetia bacterium]